MTWSKERASKEVERAINSDKDCSKLTKACYNSALKAFNCLCEDNDTGNIDITCVKQILTRLMNHKVLSPIHDTEDVWYKAESFADVYSYRCKQLTSLFKTVFTDGTIRYNDTDRVLRYNVDVSSDGSHVKVDDTPIQIGFVDRLINELYPITMPYMSADLPFKVYIEEFKYVADNDDATTYGILWVKCPWGRIDSINRYFRKTNYSINEIDEDEYRAKKLYSE